MCSRIITWNIALVILYFICFFFDYFWVRLKNHLTRCPNGISSENTANYKWNLFISLKLRNLLIWCVCVLSECVVIIRASHKHPQFRWSESVNCLRRHDFILFLLPIRMKLLLTKIPDGVWINISKMFIGHREYMRWSLFRSFSPKSPLEQPFFFCFLSYFNCSSSCRWTPIIVLTT